MMKLRLLLLLLGAVVMTACGPTEPVDPSKVDYGDTFTDTHCTRKDDRQALANFIMQCTASARGGATNQAVLSDIMGRCEEIGEKTLCPVHRHHIVVTSNGQRRIVVEIPDPHLESAAEEPPAKPLPVPSVRSESLPSQPPEST